MQASGQGKAAREGALPFAATPSPGARRWFAVALLAVVYLVAGLVFGELAGAAPSQAMVVTWRWAAWATSAIAFLLHVGYERSRLSDGLVRTAFHVSLASALGACGLAAAALVHSLTTRTGNPRLLAIALLAWPAFTMVPAFVVALAAAAMMPRRQAAESRS